MAEIEEGRLLVTLPSSWQDKWLKVDKKLVNTCQFSDMDFFYCEAEGTGAETFIFVEVSEYQPRAYKEHIECLTEAVCPDKKERTARRNAIIEQYHKEQKQELTKKALDSLLLAFSHRCDFEIHNNFITSTDNFITSSPADVKLYFIYYLAESLESLSQEERNKFRDFARDKASQIMEYQHVTKLPFTVEIFHNHRGKKLLDLGLRINPKKVKPAD